MLRVLQFVLQTSFLASPRFARAMVARDGPENFRTFLSAIRSRREQTMWLGRISCSKSLPATKAVLLRHSARD